MAVAVAAAVASAEAGADAVAAGAGTLVPTLRRWAVDVVGECDHAFHPDIIAWVRPWTWAEVVDPVHPDPAVLRYIGLSSPGDIPGTFIGATAMVGHASGREQRRASWASDVWRTHEEQTLVGTRRVARSHAFGTPGEIRRAIDEHSL